MVEVAIGRVKEELLFLELVAERDGARMSPASVGLCPQGKLLCEAHFVYVEKGASKQFEFDCREKG
jgi:hypothetical protein